MIPASAALFAAMEATWPAAQTQRCGPWLLREGKGGGQRVSAASLCAEPAEGDLTGPSLAEAEAAMGRMGEPPLFLIRSGDRAADRALAERGYRIHDPVLIYGTPVRRLAVPAPKASQTIELWPPLEIVREIWAAGGIGPARLAVMDRAKGPKTALLGRAGHRAAGVGFVAVHGSIAVLHALEVRPSLRRQGTAATILRRAAIWAAAAGADWLCLGVTEANQPARHLYASLGMEIVEQYHYRQK